MVLILCARPSEPAVDAPMSVEEMNSDGTDGVPVFPHGEVQSVQPSSNDSELTSELCIM